MDKTQRLSDTAEIVLRYLSGLVRCADCGEVVVGSLSQMRERAMCDAKALALAIMELERAGRIIVVQWSEATIGCQVV